MSLTVGAELDWDRDDRAHALHELRATRKRNRTSQVDRFDAFYKAYVSAIIAGIAAYGIAGWFGTEPITGRLLEQVTDLAPTYMGVGVALVLAIGLRSGGRGGPIALERADVRHIMLAPVAREDILRSEAIRTLRFAAFTGGAVGAVVGVIATRRLPGPPLEWIVGPMIYCAAIGVGAYGLALICSGFRIHRVLCDVLAIALLTWAAADAFLQISSSPFSWLSHVAVWPLQFDALGIAGIAVMLVLGIVGIIAAPGWSLEVAERRSRLVGQLRFAATMQDVRTVMVLQRQLAQETLRAKPRIRLPRLRKSFNKKGEPLLRVYARRCFHTWMRWSAFRVLRLVLMAVLAGCAIFASWQSTPAMIIVAGLLLWIIAMDLLEALAQESDHPDRLSNVRRPQGWDQFRLIAAPAYAQLLLVVVSLITVGVLASISGDPDGLVQTLAVPTLFLCVLLPLGGAALAVSRQPSASGGSASLSPEITGLVTLWNVAAPPAIAISGLIPLAIAHRDWEVHANISHMVQTMNTSWYIVVAIGMVAVAWVRIGAEWKSKLQASTAEAVEAQKAGSTQKSDAKTKTSKSAKQGSGQRGKSKK